MKNKSNSCRTVKKAVRLTSLFGRLSLLIALLFPSIYSKAQEIVGEEVALRYESPHPYQGGRSGGEMVWTQTISYTEKDASYVALHFSDVRIGRNDQLIVKSPDGTRTWSYSSDEINAKGNALWSIPIYGNTVIVEIHAYNPGGDFGYVVNKIARGFTQTELNLRDGDPESICGDDDSQEAMCYTTTEPIVYERGRAVARLWLNGIINCTGFLLGSEGHLMTCNHCIGNVTDAANTTVEMMAEGADCTTDCRMLGACPGTIEATSVTMVQTSCNLDYSLVQLPTNITPTYGFLQMRGTGPALGEQIYIVGHPAGWGKRVSFDSDSPQDAPDGVAHVHTLTENSCWCGGAANRVGYFADTRGGSSGSPVIAYSDHCVLAVHGCGGCPNDGANVSLIIEDLTVIPNDAIKAIEFPCGQGPDIVIADPNEIFDTDQDIPGDIIINTGAQLTVTATLRFGKEKGIRVARGAKLHVNGGILTKCPDAEDWRGINVEGNASKTQPDAFSMPAADDAGVVLINNLAHVEWARNAISTTRFNEGWNPAYWGGMVHCENATFLSNRRVAEFMKYDKPNQSKFINCTMESGGAGYAGATIWDTDNVTFENCRFYNMTSQGILTYDAGAIVRDGSSFQKNERGIEGKATYPYVGKLMIGEMGSTPNYFLDNNREHVRVESTAFGAGLEVVNNEFFGASTAIRVIGPSRYTIRANSISGSGILGIAAIQTGAMGWNQPNRVDYNGIQKAIGMIANGPNREMQFICNNFSTSIWDFRLFGSTSSGTGEIRVNQGTNFQPAGNCFTDPGIEIDILTQGPTTFFTYHAFNSQAEPCQWPLNPGNYTTNAAINANGCEVPPVIGEEPPSEDEYYLLKQQISGGGSSDQLAGWTERKDIVLNGLVSEYVSSGDVASALALLDFEGTTTAKVMKYGVLVGSGEYQAATTELNALPSTDTELTTFKQVQHINLARMQQGLGYELSQPDSAFLESVATGDLGVRSYARALMGLLKGRSYDDDDELDYVPDGGESFGINPGSGKTAVEKVSVFPNPTTGLFTVRLPEGLTATRLQVTAATGQVLLDQPIHEGQYRIDLDGKPWGKGMYLLVLRDAKGKSVHAQTIVVSQ